MLKYMILHKGVMLKCVPAAVAIGAVGGANVPPIKRAIHHAQRAVAHRFHPQPRRAICAPELGVGGPLLAIALPVPLAEAASAVMARSEPLPTSVSRWAGSIPSGGTIIGGGGPGGDPGTPGGGQPPIEVPITAVPEPATWLTVLIGMAFVALGLRMRRRAARQADDWLDDADHERQRRVTLSAEGARI